MNVLFVGLGIGKMINIKKIIEMYGNGSRFLILSLDDLLEYEGLMPVFTRGGW